MIFHLTGLLAAKEPGHCVVDVGGVGYGLSVSLNSFASLPAVGQEVKLSVHTYVREDQLVLFGFSTPKERTVFRKLINISGIGPKIAMAMLSGLTPDDIVDAVGSRDSARLSTIPGIGKKTAERMIVELGDMFSREMTVRTARDASRTPIFEDALSALLNLGYTRANAENALKRAEVSESMRVEQAIKAALKELCRA